MQNDVTAHYMCDLQQVHYLREAWTGRGLLLEDAAPASTPVHHPLQDFADDFVKVAERSNRYFANLVGEGGG